MTIPSSAAGLAVRKLRCERGDRCLFTDLSFDLQPGQVMQIEGANGSGKTSLIRTLCGLLHPTAGDILWQGEVISTIRPEYYSQLTYIGHQPGIKLEMTPLENLQFIQKLQQGHCNSSELRQALERIGLYGFEETPCRHLSAGQRRRVALARLCLSRAPLWILDEPFTALDRAGIDRLYGLLTEHLQRNGMVILTSHQTVELASVTIVRLALH